MKGDSAARTLENDLHVHRPDNCWPKRTNGRAFRERQNNFLLKSKVSYAETIFSPAEKVTATAF
jgi:hypothetical protein